MAAAATTRPTASPVTLDAPAHPVASPAATARAVRCLVVVARTRWAAATRARAVAKVSVASTTKKWLYWMASTQVAHTRAAANPAARPRRPRPAASRASSNTARVVSESSTAESNRPTRWLW